MTDKHNQSDVIALNNNAESVWDAHVPAFIRYWESRRKLGDVPRRTDIDPRGIEPLLENALIAERIAPGLARLRIAGTHLSELMGMEVRGMPVSAFMTPDTREELAGILADLFERPAMVDLRLSSAAGLGRAEMKGRLVLLPLRSDLGDVSRALGCLVTEGAIGRTPRRFTITQRKVTPVELPKASGSGLAEAQAPYTPKDEAAHPSERSYLKIIK